VTVPAIELLLADASATHGVTDVVMGMPHRGRLAVLAHVLKKPYVDIFREYLDADTHARALRPGEDSWYSESRRRVAAAHHTYAS
jgi:2-oxoglutarate dehydrogenase complex dehydrogenase (E1) component-like enzyme